MSKNIGSRSLIQSMTKSKSFHYLNHLSILYVNAAASQGQKGAPIRNSCWSCHAKIDRALLGNPVLEQQRKTTLGVSILKGSESQLWRHLPSQLTLGLSMYKLLAPAAHAAPHPCKCKHKPCSWQWGQAEPSSWSQQGSAQAGARTAAKLFQHPSVTLAKALIRSCKSIKLNHLPYLNISPFWRNTSTSQNKCTPLH